MTQQIVRETLTHNVDAPERFPMIPPITQLRERLTCTMLSVGIVQRQSSDPLIRAHLDDILDSLWDMATYVEALAPLPTHTFPAQEAVRIVITAKATPTLRLATV